MNDGNGIIGVDMTDFITSDWHLGEDRFEIMGRPGFVSAQHMVDEFIFLHNELVEPDDTVYVVGDAVNLNTPEFLSQVSHFNGRKILFRGNHDRVFTDEQLSKYFDEIVAEGDGLEIDVEGVPCWITHYPTQGRADRFNLVGHIHSAWKVQLNSFNVGVDVNHFRPHVLNKAVPFFHKAITEFYDQDVWVAYREINEHFKGKRGKPGRYLDVDGNVGGGS